MGVREKPLLLGLNCAVHCVCAKAQAIIILHLQPHYFHILNTKLAQNENKNITEGQTYAYFGVHYCTFIQIPTRWRRRQFIDKNQKKNP